MKSIHEQPVSFKLAKSADWHMRLGSGSELAHGMVNHVVHSMGAKNPDAVLLAGDMTDNGTLPATKIVARALRVLSDSNIPVFAVFGNHDYPRDRDLQRTRMRLAEQKAIYRDIGGVKVLDGNSDVIRKRVEGRKYSIGIFGITGGYDGSFLDKEGGEDIVVPDMRGQDLERSLEKLKNFLIHLREKNNIILMHYAPSQEMLTRRLSSGAIVAGSNRFSDLIQAFQHKLNGVFHGHVHNGLRYGKIGSVDVMNVAMQVGVYQSGKRREQLKPHDYYHVHDVVLR